MKRSDAVSQMNHQVIQTTWPGRCFGCSQRNPHGLQLQFMPTEVGCRTHCMVPDQFCGFDGIAHGGIISLLLDEAAIWAIAVQLGELGVTADLTVRFHKPVSTGVELTLEGTLVSHNNGKAVTRSTVYSMAGTLLAEAESTWAMVSLSSFSEMMDVPVEILEQFFDGLQAEVKSMRNRGLKDEQ